MNRAKTTLILALLADAALAYLHATHLAPVLWAHGSSSAFDAAVGIFVLLGCIGITAGALLLIEFTAPSRKGRP